VHLSVPRPPLPAQVRLPVRRRVRPRSRPGPPRQAATHPNRPGRISAPRVHCLVPGALLEVSAGVDHWPGTAPIAAPRAQPPSRNSSNRLCVSVRPVSRSSPWNAAITSRQRALGRLSRSALRLFRRGRPAEREAREVVRDAERCPEEADPCPRWPHQHLASSAQPSPAAPPVQARFKDRKNR